jgi:hypothetical protein
MHTSRRSAANLIHSFWRRLRDRRRSLAKHRVQPPMSIAEIRDAFESFAGTERFNKFVTVFHQPDRRNQPLRYWQTKLWSEFLEIYPGDAPPAEDTTNLSRILNFCPLHRVELTSGTAAVVNGSVPFEPQLAYAQANRFPFANRVAYANISPKGAITTETSYCPACRDAYMTWAADDALTDTQITDTFESKGGRIVAAFSVPFQASHKITVGTDVLLLPPGKNGYRTKIADLERSRNCFNDGRSGLKIIHVVFADVDTVDQIPVGTMLSFNLDT